MQEILNILFWAGALAGGLLILLLLVSIFSGLEIGGDLDVDMGGDVDVDAGGDMDGHLDGDGSAAGLGAIKTSLAFISVGAFTARAIFLNTSWSWTIVILAALVAGAVAVMVLTWFFRWLLRNQEEGNWHLWQAEGKVGTVYVPIPPEGKGRIIIEIDNVRREIAARSENGQQLRTHEKAFVVKAEEDHVVVIPYAS